MKVEELRPKLLVTKSSLQCEAPVPTDESWNPAWLISRRERAVRKGYDPEKCTRGATIRIDGVPLCRQHAGSIAIATLVREARAEHLEPPEDTHFDS
jgi:hypothetical protein